MNTTVAFWLVLTLQALLLLVALAMLQWQVISMTSVPWVRTPRWKTRKMLTLAGLKPGERIVDFGSGDGSTVIDAARDFGAGGCGIETQWSLCGAARLRAFLMGLSGRTTFVRGDIFKRPMPDADVVFCYLFPEINARLEPLLKTRYPSGTRVISRTFAFPTLPLIATERIGAETISLYKIP